METREFTNIIPFSAVELQAEIDKYKQHPGQEATLVHSLLREKDKFKQVFQTEKGSYYFVLKTGESFRIKNNSADPAKENFEITEVLQKIYFITPDQNEHLKAIYYNDGPLGIRNKTINPSTCIVGNFPIEIVDQKYVEESKSLVKFKDNLEPHSIHYGHTISNIIKAAGMIKAKV